ncbi:hypothetical protein [uncultured Sphingomonas sp.]|uniref:hypothetical protein n=1 Tax=uncultured Sphingomonas sp. TaxID=158754 RepID=UPI0035C9F669
MRRLLQALAIVVLLGVGYAGWLRYRERYVVETRDDGVAVAKVVAERFARSASLRVGTLSGMVQSTATDARGLGLLRSDRVVKAPYAVDYFVDAGQIGPGAMRWDASARTLLVDAPDVTVGPSSIDEAHRTLTRDRGLFVTRGAFEDMSRATAVKAQTMVEARARDPKNVALARDNARVVIADLLGAPLRAAGFHGVTVRVRLAGDPRPSEDQRRWDVSRSIEDVLREP